MRCEHRGRAARAVRVGVIVATGSPAHVDLLRARGGPVDGADEHDVYRTLGIPYCPPEVRDGDGEVGATWDELVEQPSVTTAFHCHTTYSDGKDSIEAMARAASELGFSAITITDHSAAASYAGGIGLDGLRAQAAEIAELRGRVPVRILHGTEADILVDGAIDVPPEALGELDLVIASVHQRYKLDEAATTARLVAAMRAPFFKVWGHALGRLVLRRDPVAVRIDDVLDAIADSPAAIAAQRRSLSPRSTARARAASRRPWCDVRVVERCPLDARPRGGALGRRTVPARADPALARAQHAATGRARGADPAACELGEVVIRSTSLAAPQAPQEQQEQVRRA